MINVLINGSNGNMGKALIQYIKDNTSDVFIQYMIAKDSELSFDLLDKKINSCHDKDFKKPDVIIDFSVPEATFLALDFASKNLVPIVIATTGFNNQEVLRIKEYSEAIPVFKASNMCYSINLISEVLKNIAPLLSNMDIEIIEKHHNMKKDAPSGTALLFADAINSNIENKYNYVFNRHSRDELKQNTEIGFSSVRGGKLVGEHSVMFLGENESIELKHTAYSRIIFAEGAIRATRFIINKKSGLYSMQDLMK